jgi:hypothetical protein
MVSQAGSQTSGTAVAQTGRDGLGMSGMSESEARIPPGRGSLKPTGTLRTRNMAAGMPLPSVVRPSGDLTGRPAPMTVLDEGQRH